MNAFRPCLDFDGTTRDAKMYHFQACGFTLPKQGRAMHR